MNVNAIISAEEAARSLREGGVVALPTETVYGLAAVFDNEDAVRTIFRIKGRPAENPVIVHVASLEQAATVGIFNDVAARLAAHFWPGPLTLVLPRQHGVPDIVTAGLDTVAIRMPDHATFLAVISRVRKPLAAPSANLSGKPSPTMARHVIEDFGGSVRVVDGGATRIGIESTVVLAELDRIIVLRPGAITREQLFEVGGVPVVDAAREDRKASPGTRFKHYAPSARVVLLTTPAPWDLGPGSRLVLSRTDPGIGIPWRPLREETLYADLRWADELHVDEILVHCDEAILRNEALLDRLRHAAGLATENDVGT